MDIQFQEFDLKNGLHVILHQESTVPIVSVNLWYRVGSRNEQPGKTGYAHLFEHMMFQGSQHIPPEMHFQLIQSVGGTLNGSTFFDRTNYYETLPSHYLELGLWLESDRMGFLLPALNEEKFQTQLEVVKNERRQRYENQPYGLWLEKLLELAFEPDYPYHWPVIGYMEDLDRATLEDIKDFFKTYYAPNNASLVLSGDFDPVQARELIELYFAPIPPNDKIPKTEKHFDAYNSGEKQAVVQDNVHLPRIHMAYHLPGIGSDEIYPADIITGILNGGKSSRLYQKLIYRKQIVQDIQSFILPMTDTSLLFIIATPYPDVKIETVQKELEDELTRLQQEKVPFPELERVKNQIVAHKIRDLQSVSVRADMLNMFYTYFKDAERLNRDIDYYMDVNEESIMQTAQKYLNPENRVNVTFVPKTSR
ncbi:insulinase family protein [candidate division KSB1 bacterium]|nr:MAG: insulinase family protein [candidate division KSB1 bacterium]